MLSEPRLHPGDCLDVLPTLPEASVDAVCCDPPYELNFMGKAFDRTGVSFDPATWRAVLRVLKPGGYMVAFGGSRTYHRLACAVEDAGWEIRDCLMWVYGTGFPKGQGCLKPAWEPILLARKPGSKVLPLGIDECRVPTNGEVITGRMDCDGKHEGWDRPWMRDKEKVREKLQAAYDRANTLGRYPANLVHDGSDEVLEAFAAFGERRSSCGGGHRLSSGMGYMGAPGDGEASVQYSDTGSAARFFYTAKASRKERGEGNSHPCVKPLSLVSWLVKLVCPVGGTVLDPFLGSGTTAVACLSTGRDFVGIEKEPDYFAIAEKRIAQAQGLEPLFAGATDSKEE